MGRTPNSCSSQSVWSDSIPKSFVINIFPDFLEKSGNIGLFAEAELIEDVVRA